VAFLYRLLPPRPTFPADMAPAEAEVMERHFAYWQELIGLGVAVAYGPVLDPNGTWGLGLLDLEDEEAARDVGAQDPAVEGGVCTFEVLPMDLVKPS
jgi:uncharacterized protein YciI